jgi:predicted ribonuclease YlaK
MQNEFAVDTNILLDYPQILNEYEKINIHSIVCEEIDNIIHNSLDEEKRYKARQARNAIKISKNIVFSTHSPMFALPTGWDERKNDNILLRVCKDLNWVLITNDLAMQVKAIPIKVVSKTYSPIDENRNYKGFKIVEMTDNELANWYSSEVKSNMWDLNVNEYMLIKSLTEDDLVDCWCWTAKGFRHLNLNNIESKALGKISPKDIYQKCIIDSFTNNAVTMVRGSAGTGKSLLTIAYGMSMLEKGKLNKIIVFTNPVPTKNSIQLGYYSGSKDEKLMQNSIGNMLGSKLGNKDAIITMINNEILEILPFSDIRGYDTSGKKALIWITEAQNLNVELMQLAIQRVGDDCKIVIDGDYSTQIDMKQFEINNGMKKVSEVFTGKDYYGEIELQNIYRSKWAERAELLTVKK